MCRERPGYLGEMPRAGKSTSLVDGLVTIKGKADKPRVFLWVRNQIDTMVVQIGAVAKGSVSEWFMLGWL